MTIHIYLHLALPDENIEYITESCFLNRYCLFYLQMPIISYCLFTNAFYRPTGVYQFCSSLKVGTTSLNWSNS